MDVMQLPELDPAQYDEIPNPEHHEIYVFDNSSKSLFKSQF